MSHSSAILGKGGTGKTFVAAHLAMALGTMGVRTLLVGCDQKRDTARALSREPRAGLVDLLEQHGYDYDGVTEEALLTPVTGYLDVMELGAAHLLVGHYTAVLDEAFHVLDLLGLWKRYDHVMFDVGDERFDANLTPLLRRVETGIAVTTEAVEALWVANRLIRAAVIGRYELGTELQLLGAVNNRSLDPRPFERFVERTRLFPLLTVPEEAELSHLRPFSRTLFGVERLPESLRPVRDGFLTAADFLRGNPYSVFALDPMPDEEVWRLAPPVSLPG